MTALWSVGGLHPHEAELARLMCGGSASSGCSNSGTEANLMALTTAIAATGRSRLLAFAGGYRRSALLRERRGGLERSYDFVVAPYNDLEAAVSLIDEELAGVIVEADARRRRLSRPTRSS